MAENKRSLNNILVTGGAGFIGSNFIRYVFEDTDFSGRIVNLDKLTYAGDRENLREIEDKFGGERYFFSETDICSIDDVKAIFDEYEIDTVIHFAAESHVDRSITGPAEFIQTNIVGTFTLLETARDIWDGDEANLFHHISTDEVYGSLGKEGYFIETTPYDPKSPYSASKASSDHLVRAYSNTYKMAVTLSNCSNNYGPYQYPEKLIPLMIRHAIEGKDLPVYGDGANIRDWLYVTDHCSAIWKIITEGKTGETYNIGGDSEKKNIEVVNEICAVLDKIYPVPDNPASGCKTSYSELIKFVTDRPGHDRRYAIDCQKIKNDLDWKPSVSFAKGLETTVRWYLKKFPG
ncbi:MAG: dTDP-glucose 4,6-dehydratase [Acidobacteriota bacterium]